MFEAVLDRVRGWFGISRQMSRKPEVLMLCCSHCGKAALVPMQEGQRYRCPHCEFTVTDAKLADPGMEALFALPFDAALKDCRWCGYPKGRTKPTCPGCGVNEPRILADAESLARRLSGNS